MSGTANSYLLDTNIFIYYFNGEALLEPLFEDIFSGRAIAAYSPITWVELLCYPALTEAEADQIRSSLKSLKRVDLTESVLDTAAQIRRSARITLPDAIIAASALETASQLVTRNIADFARVESLTVLNPFAEI